MSNVGGTVTAPPGGTVITWSQSSTTWTVTATGYDQKAVASQSDSQATATGTDASATQTSTSGDTNGASNLKPMSFLALTGLLGLVLAW